MRYDDSQHSLRRSGRPADAPPRGAYGAVEIVAPLAAMPDSLPVMATDTQGTTLVVGGAGKTCRHGYPAEFTVR